MAHGSGRATLAAVAASAGVSIATASKVLNGRSDVSASTRARVKDALQQHEYVGRRPEPVGRTTVELCLQGVLNSYSVEVVQGVLDAGGLAGVDVVVSTHPRSGRAGPWVRNVIAAGRQAVIGVVCQLSASDLSALAQARLPLVVIDPLNVAQPDVTSVGSTNFSGGMVATEYLLSLGHRSIAYLGGPVTAGCNQARMHGFRGAMERAGVPVRDEYVRCRDFLYADGLAGAAVLLDLPQPPTAIFAGSDEVALGVIEAARGRGLRVPEDLRL